MKSFKIYLLLIFIYLKVPLVLAQVHQVDTEFEKKVRKDPNKVFAFALWKTMSETQHKYKDSCIVSISFIKFKINQEGKIHGFLLSKNVPVWLKEDIEKALALMDWKWKNQRKKSHSDSLYYFIPVVYAFVKDCENNHFLWLHKSMMAQKSMTFEDSRIRASIQLNTVKIFLKKELKVYTER